LGALGLGLNMAKEIGTRWDIPVVGGTSSKVAFAYVLGNRVSREVIRVQARQAFQEIQLSSSQIDECTGKRFGILNRKGLDSFFVNPSIGRRKIYEANHYPTL
jgi:hypothetical protein